MAVDPQIVLAEQKYRSSLLAGNTDTRKALLKAYASSIKSLDLKIAAITNQIQTARDAGEAVSASWLMQQKRYREMQTEATSMVQRLSGAIASNLTADQLNATKAAEMMVGQASGPVFNKLPASAIESVVGTTTKGSPLRALLDSFNLNGSDDASRYLRSRLIAGIATGTPAALLAQQMSAGVEGLTLSRAMTISRTETQRALRRATTLSIAANKDLIAGWVWRSAADERTCAACFSLHGTFFPGSTPMRAHPNCRCIMIPKRIVKDDPFHMGGAVKVGNGSDLFKALPQDSQMRILGKGRYDLYASGKVPLNGMRTMRTNPIWGPSYQVKSLKQIKADLDNPPPVPKPKTPKPLQPTGAPPSPLVVDEVAVAEQAASVAPKAVSVAPKATTVQKYEQKIAAQESQLLDVAEAERRFLTSPPELDGESLLRWRTAQNVDEPHIVRFRQITNTDNLYEIDRSVRSALQNSYYGEGEHGWWYTVERRSSIINGPTTQYEQTYTIWRTTKRIKTPYSGASLTNPNYLRSVIRAMPSQTDDMRLILSKARIEKVLSDAKIALERSLNPNTAPARTMKARPAPKEITVDDYYRIKQEAEDARMGYIGQQHATYAGEIEGKKIEDWLVGSDDVFGQTTNKEIIEYMTRVGDKSLTEDIFGSPVPQYGQFVRGSILFQSDNGIIGGYRTYTMTRIKTDMITALREHFDAGLGAVAPWGDEWLGYVEGVSPEAFAAIKAETTLMHDLTAWEDYKYLKSISKKSINEVPVGLGGTTVPIPASSTFTGKYKKWTTRDDFNSYDAAARAKDRVSYEISQKLAKDDAFIDSMARNDHLGQWIGDAGRSGRPAVVRAAAKWERWTIKERETFLRTGSAEGGYFDWSVKTDYGTGAPQFVKGQWHNSATADGQAFIYDYTAQMVQQWAVTSGDAHVLSVGMQRAAMEEFSLQATTTLEHFAERAHSGGYGVPPGPLLDASEAFYAANGDSIRRFLRQMYDVTQEELALAGIDTIRVVRGVSSVPKAAQLEWLGEHSGTSLGINEERAGAVDLQPMSSFAVSTGTAKKFGGTLMYVDVPASWVVGTCRTGFGCLNEYEWVLLGGPMRANLTRVNRF